jgi:hypothetical protein
MRSRVGVWLLLALVGVGAHAHARKAKAAPVAKPAAPVADETVMAAVARAGWPEPQLLARGPGERGPLAVVQSERDGGIKVLATVAQPGAAPARLLVLDVVDSAKTSVKATATTFLDSPELLDVLVEQKPFVTDGHRTTSQHFIVRRRGATLQLACRFDGGASSSGKEGYSGHSIAVEKVTAGKLLTFDLRKDATSSEHPGDHQITVARWEIPPTGICRERH